MWQWLRALGGPAGAAIGSGLGSLILESLNEEYPDSSVFGIVDDNYEAYRMDKRLVSVVKKLGVDKASGSHAKLRIVSVPDDVVDIHGWYVHDYDGVESVHQSHWSS